MPSTHQTRLTDFDGNGELSLPPEVLKRRIPEGQIWEKTIESPEDWGVCNFDGTVLLVRITDGKIHAHGTEARCRWCKGDLEIQDRKVFCAGVCKTYQGQFSRNLNMYLRWEGAKSYTLRKEIARIEGLDLEERDLQPIAYAPKWSAFDEYETETEEVQG